MSIVRTAAVAAAILAFCLPATPRATAAEVPLPDDIRIVAPDAAVPEALQRFQGKWSGQWSGKLDTVVIVERIEPSGQATLVYAWGDYAPWKATRDWVRWQARIAGDTMILDRFPNGALTRFVFRGDGSLGGTYEAQRYVHHGTFRPGRE
ncbi:hypothetical protein [Thalassobaculum sp.]|uniref:hypothetical protein n=1 Tax=Thalassobaculum sp. TaxID=2022740 RepID=UPI0032EAE080